MSAYSDQSKRKKKGPTREQYVRQRMDYLKQAAQSTTPVDVSMFADEHHPLVAYRGGTKEALNRLLAASGSISGDGTPLIDNGEYTDGEIGSVTGFLKG